MALLHDATLTPSKLDLLAGWLAEQPWFDGDPSTLARVAAYRFDDPAGKVGLEVMLVAAGDGPVVQVPLTYRDAPLPEGDAWLVGTSQHSVLGRRWVYVGEGDPVFVSCLVSTIVTGGHEAGLELDKDGRRVVVPPSARVHGTGTPDTVVPVATRFSVDDQGETVVVRSRGVVLRIPRLPGPDDPAAGLRLVGSWDASGDRLLATAELLE